MARQKILGIDPGSRHTGYAILTVGDGIYIADEYDVIHLDKIADHTERLCKIYQEVSRILEAHKPDFCAVETPVYGIDPLAMLKLGRAQAAAILAIANKGIPVAEYYPKAVKKSITGNGNASKKQVAYMLEKLVKLPDSKLAGDATDALAVAWCHYSKLTSPSGTKSDKKYHQNNRKSSWKEFILDNPDRVKG